MEGGWVVELLCEHRTTCYDVHFTMALASAGTNMPRGVRHGCQMSTLTTNDLERWSEVALTSTDASLRAQATEALRPLCHFEQWEHLRDMFESTHHPYAIFMLGKAATFIIQNEVGPTERATMQDYLMGFVQQRRRSDNLPRFLIHHLLGVVANAFYMNWRSMILTMEESDVGEGITARIEERLTRMLDHDLVLMLMDLIVGVFCRERTRSSLASIYNSFVSRGLLCFFTFATRCLATAPLAPLALELCCQCLDVVPPPSAAPLIGVRIVTEDIIYLCSIEQWIPHLGVALHYCASVISSLSQTADDFTGAQGHAALRLFALASCVSYQEVQVIPSERETILRFMIELAHSMVDAYRATRTSAVLSAAMRVLVSIFERSPDEVALLLERYMPLINSVGLVTQTVSALREATDDDTRGLLMHFLSLVAEHGRAPEAGQQHPAHAIVLAAFRAYFDGVIQSCHLEEDSKEIETEEALQLQAENYLRPIARLANMGSEDLFPIVRTALHDATSNYDTCMRLRSGQSADETAIVSLMVLSTPNMGNYGIDDVVLLSRHITLSRIAVIVSVIGLMLQLKSAASYVFVSDASTSPEMELLNDVLSFLRGFITEDVSDDLSSLMLAGGGTQGGRLKPIKAHIGIQRALHYFCVSVLKSSYGAVPALVTAAVQLCLGVLTKHDLGSPILLADAVMLAGQLITDDNAVHCHLSSEVWTATFDMHRRGQLPLTSLAIVSALITTMGERTRKLRKRFISLLAAAAQVRYRTGCDDSMATVKALLENASVVLDEAADGTEFPQHALLIVTQDVRGILKGLTMPVLMLKVLQWFLNGRAQWRRAASRNAEFCGSVLKLLGLVAERCTLHWSEDLSSQLPFELASFMLAEVSSILQVRLQAAHSLTAAEVASIARLLSNLFKGRWCNLALMSYYGDAGLHASVSLALQFLVRCDVSDLMTLKLKRRDAVFDTVACANNLACVMEAVDKAFTAEEHQRLNAELLRFLTAAFVAHPNFNTIRAMRAVVVATPHSLPEDQVVVTFEELVIALATNASPVEGLDDMCATITQLHAVAPAAAEAVLNSLLQSCSAFHRVRLRCLLMMLRNPPANLSLSYGNIFGRNNNATTETTLAAW